MGMGALSHGRWSREPCSMRDEVQTPALSQSSLSLSSPWASTAREGTVGFGLRTRAAPGLGLTVGDSEKPTSREIRGSSLPSAHIPGVRPQLHPTLPPWELSSSPAVTRLLLAPTAVTKLLAFIISLSPFPGSSKAAHLSMQDVGHGANISSAGTGLSGSSISSLQWCSAA